MARTRNQTKPKSRTSLVKQISSRSKRVVTRRTKEKAQPKDLIPSPSTLLNCACTDHHGGAFSAGRMVNLIGDSAAGKTILALSICAEMSLQSRFDDYRFIFDDVENADGFDHRYLFGQDVQDRLEAPHIDRDGVPVPSDIIEDFHFNLLDALADPRPFIYIVDSWDALDSKQDQEKIGKMKEARDKGNKVAGSYGMSKPKKASEILRNVCGKLKKSNSLLIIISQTRDNIDPMSFEKKTRSGGRALKFYAYHEIWLASIKKIPKKDRIIGHHVRAKVSKNKYTGKVREVDFPVFYDYGVDNLSSCIDFLVENQIIVKNKLTIEIESLGIKGTKEKLINQIEDQNLEPDIFVLAGEAWMDIEESLKMARKRKY